MKVEIKITSGKVIIQYEKETDRYNVLAVQEEMIKLHESLINAGYKFKIESDNNDE